MRWWVQKPSRVAVAEECERRVLYSADLNPALWAGGAGESASTAIVASVNPAQTSVTTSLEPTQLQRARQELVFVDANVADSDKLIDSILANRPKDTQVEIITLRSDLDGLSQISEVLEHEQNVDAVHIISHGAAGELQLGNARVTAQTLQERSAELNKWRTSLTSDADLLLYGCDVGRGATGAEFVGKLAQVTQADVAASTDITGSKELGGNWVLELAEGRVDSASVVPTKNLWWGTLASNNSPTFSNGPGFVTTTLTSGSDLGYAMAIQPDGKVLVVGESGSGSDNDFALVRYNTDGTRDTSFGGGDGKVRTDFNGLRDEAYDIAVQNDGKIVVVGYSDNGTKTLTALARYNSNGTLDTSFGGGTGRVTTNFGPGFHEGLAVDIQADGKILVATETLTSGFYDATIARYLSDGSLDTSFAGTGFFTVPSGSTESLEGIGVREQPDGKVLYLGTTQTGTNKDVFLMRRNGDGTLDTSFGGLGLGYAVTDLGGADDFGYYLELQSDGKIVVSAASGSSSNHNFAVVRYNTNGTLDTSFGGGKGFTVTPIGSGNDDARSITVQADGKILLAGQARSGSGFNLAIARYNSNGTLDNSFGGTGIVTSVLGSDSARAWDVAIQADGKIVVVGERTLGGKFDFAVARYNTNGSLDPEFGGTTTLNGNPAFTEGGAAVTLDGDVDVRDAELDARNGGLGDYNGAKLTLVRNLGPNANDVFGFVDGNNITRSGETLLKSGRVFAMFDTTSTPGQLVVTFTVANGQIPTSANVDAVLRQITYKNMSNGPGTSVTINWTLSDSNTGSQGTGGALSATGSTAVRITRVNDAPVVTTSTGPLIYSEGSGAKAINPSLAMSDVDSASLVGATVTISGNYNLGQDVLGFVDKSGITGNWNASTGVLTLTGNATVAEYRSALRSVTYNNTSGNPQTALRTVSFQVDDGSPTNNLSSMATFNIEIGSLNGKPESNPVTLPSITEDSGTILIGQADLLANATDSDSSLLTASGLTVVSGSGVLVDNGNGTWNFTPAANDDTSVDFSYTVTDGSSNVTGSMYLDLLPGNDAPISISPASLVIDETTRGGTVVANLLASDPDIGDQFAYQLVSDASGQFSIDPGTNILRVSSGTQFDYAKQSEFDLEVRVTDSAGLSRLQTLKVGLRSIVTEAPPAPVPEPAPTPAPAPSAAPAPAATPTPAPGPAPAPAPTPAPPPPPPPPPPAPPAPQPQNGEQPSLYPLLGTAEQLDPQRVVIASAASGASPNAAIQQDRETVSLALQSVSFEISGNSLSPLADSFGMVQFADSPPNPISKMLKITGVEKSADGTSASAAATQVIEPLQGVKLLLGNPIHVASVTFTSGFLWYLTRSGGLITSIVMGVPAWRQVDLLPVLLNQAELDAKAARRRGAHNKGRFALSTHRTIIDSIIGDNSMVSRLFDHSKMPGYTVEPMVYRAPAELASKHQGDVKSSEPPKEVKVSLESEEQSYYFERRRGKRRKA